jgi:hypothetical protein
MRLRRVAPFVLLTVACWVPSAATEDWVELVRPEPPAVQPVKAEGGDGPTVEFLSGDDAFEIIDGPWTTWYFEQWSERGLNAKTSVELPEGKTRVARLRKAYRSSILEFTSDEQATLREGIDKVHAILAANYPLLADTTWRFIKTDGKLDGGLPQTLDSAIILQPGWLDWLSEAPPEQRTPALVGLLSHELLHVVQRAQAGRFNPAYRDIFGFTQARSILGPPSLAERRLLNPDADGVEWVYELEGEQGSRWIWVTILTAPEVAENLSLRNMYDARVEVKPTEEGFRVVVDDEGIPVELTAEELTAFKQRFAYTPLIDHPGEIAAYALGQLLMADVLGREAPAEDAENPAERDLARLRGWLMKERRAAAASPAR